MRLASACDSHSCACGLRAPLKPERSWFDSRGWDEWKTRCLEKPIISARATRGPEVTHGVLLEVLSPDRGRSPGPRPARPGPELGRRPRVGRRRLDAARSLPRARLG